MHQSIKFAIAGVASSIVGWLLIIAGNGLYALFTTKPPSASSDFTIINWTVSLVVSGIIFVIIYIKLTDWIEG